MDEVIAQLLASEGFATVEEIAYVEPEEVSEIEGFDEDTAAEIQARAVEYLEKLDQERDAKRKELGVEDDVADVPGVTNAMLVAFGENDVKSVEDLAGCATDDLTGYYENVDGERRREPGFLDGHDVSPQEAEDIIMAARVKAGWITEEDLAAMRAEAEADEDGEFDGEGAEEGEATAEAEETPAE